MGGSQVCGGRCPHLLSQKKPAAAARRRSQRGGLDAASADEADVLPPREVCRSYRGIKRACHTPAAARTADCCQRGAGNAGAGRSCDVNLIGGRLYLCWRGGSASFPASCRAHGGRSLWGSLGAPHRDTSGGRLILRWFATCEACDSAGGDPRAGGQKWVAHITH